MSDIYLFLPRLRVQGANAQATWWLVNATPVMACAMFGHALGRHLEETVSGVAIIHHDAQLHGEQFKWFRPEQRRGAMFINKTDYSSKNPHALSLQPTASFSGEFSLVMQFDESAEIDVGAVNQFLTQARLAGGQIIEHGPPSIEASVTKLRDRLGTGYWVVDRRDLMEKANEEDWLDVLLRVTARPEWTHLTKSAVPAVLDAASESDEAVEMPTQTEELPNELPSSWIVATNLGYALLTKAEVRAGARDSFPHAFVEPLVGPVQYVSIRHYGERALPMWQHGWPQDDVFLLTQPE